MGARSLADGRAELRVEETPEGLRVAAAGAWTVETVAEIDDRLRAVAGRGRLDLSALESLDTTGAWLLHRTRVRCGAEVGTVAPIEGGRPEHAALIEAVARKARPCEIAPPASPSAIAMLGRLGAGIFDAGREALALLGFLGLCLETLARGVFRPRAWRVTSLVSHMESAGLNALPIVGLMSFLIGVVLAFQGAVQLQRFGAEVFVVNLIGVTILREIGVLMTAIIVAGRSGSAFTAQIGAMKVNEEIDAMRAIGLDPIEVLVIPRMLALIIMLPLLAAMANLLGLFGGAMMAWVALDISPALFLERLNATTPIEHFWVGIVKAPVFAALIAVVGCFNGLRVRGTAESVGALTTASVVASIFLVIIVDALFSIVFASVGV